MILDKEGLCCYSFAAHAETIDLLVRCHSILFHYVLPSEVEQMFNVLV